MTVFKNAKIVYPDRIRDGIVVTDNGKITGIHKRFDAIDGAYVDD